MMTNKKKPYIPFIIMGALIAAILGYLVNGAWKQGMEFNDFLDSFMAVLNNPLRDYFNQNTFKAILTALIIYALIITMYYTSQHNMMPGKEYGSARLASPKEMNRVTADKDDSKNRILSQNVRFSIDTAKTKLNNNVMVIGGSGAGKTFYVVEAIMLQLLDSMIITDPKGELYERMAPMLRANGYIVKQLNLVEMDKSDCYNPFVYIRQEADIVKLVTNLMANTTPKNSAPTDPFWDKSEGMFLQALFYYVWLEVPLAQRNMGTVMELLSMAEVTEKDKPSELDVKMSYLEATSPLGKNHPAVRQYRKCMRGAGDTVRSIIISANARLARLENQQILRLLSKDEMNIADIGAGAGSDGHTKTALFCIIPDSDKSYNFVVGLLYTQIFQELYYQADFVYDKKLPIPVTFMLDEFANVALPDDFCSLLSTMRSRNISSVIIIQNLAQIKALFKDTWETLTGNCDTTIYLGGNEASTHDYVSKQLLGKQTIEKRSSGFSKGRQGSSSTNYDVIGREIMTPDEVRMMDNKKCIVVVRGLNPVMDDKSHTMEHPRYYQTVNTEVTVSADNIDPGWTILSPEGLKSYEIRRDKGEAVYIDKLTYDEFMLLGEKNFTKRFMDLEYTPDVDTERNLVSELIELRKSVQKENDSSSDTDTSSDDTSGGPFINKTIKDLIQDGSFTPGQRRELERAVSDKLPEDYILTYADPENSIVKMMTMRMKYLQTNSIKNHLRTKSD